MNEKVLKELKKLKPILKDKFGIEKMAIFGSIARGEDNEKSDIDIAILKSQKKDYFELLEIKYFLKEKLKKEIDIGYYDGIRKIFKKHIDKDLIYV